MTDGNVTSPPKPAPGGGGLKVHTAPDGKEWVFERLVNGRSGDTTDSGTSGKMLAASNEPLRSILLVNTSGSTLYVGGPSVTSASGFPLASNQSITIAPTDPKNRVKAADVFVTGGGTSGLSYAWVGMA